jgi:PE-PPE domain-containing protein
VTASGATPSDLYPTEIITHEYDGFADFPRYPINLLSDLPAYLGIIFQHTAYVDLTPQQLADATDVGTYGDTTYFMVTTDELPLLDLLRFIPGGNPLSDLLQPDLSVLVNLGYGSITDGWDTQSTPDVPTPFGLFPTDINPTDIFNALVQGIPEGISKAIEDIQSGQWTDHSSLQGLLDAAHTFGLTPSHTPTLSELLGAGATYFNGDVPTTPITADSSLTDIVNVLTHLVSTDASALLPAFDTLLALGVSLPNYDISLFEQGLESGNLLAAIGDPLAADIGILPLPIGLDAAVLGEALATTAYDLIGGFIP